MSPSIHGLNFHKVTYSNVQKNKSIKIHKKNRKQVGEHNPYIFNGKTIGNLTFSVEFSIFSKFSKVNV